MKMLNYLGDGLIGLAVAIFGLSMLCMVTQGLLIMAGTLDLQRPYALWLHGLVAAMWIAVAGWGCKAASRW